MNYEALYYAGRVWLPPENSRFVEYDPSDYGWLEALGFGQYTIARIYV